MRSIGVVALAFIAGCSAIWSMDDYEGGTRATSSPRDGGGSSTSSGSAGGSSGGSSGVVFADSGEPGKTQDECKGETEPNDRPDQANAILVGVTCGAISEISDLDFFTVDATAMRVDLRVILGQHLQLIVDGAQTYDTPGEVQLTFSGSKKELLFQTFDGEPGTYEITR